MTQKLYQNAIKFAGEKHKNQTVPGTDSNYLLHISNVAMEIIMAYTVSKDFDINYAVQLAILHDTLEDTETEFNELRDVFGENVANGVLALTKNDSISTKNERMIDSLKRVNALGKEVGMVKLADRITNLQKPPNHWSIDKISNYLSEAILIDKILDNKNAYLNNRLRGKIIVYKSYTD